MRDGLKSELKAAAIKRADTAMTIRSWAKGVPSAEASASCAWRAAVARGGASHGRGWLRWAGHVGAHHAGGFLTFFFCFLVGVALAESIKDTPMGKLL